MLKIGDKVKLTKTYSKLLFELEVGEKGTVTEHDLVSDLYVVAFREHVTVRMSQMEVEQYLTKVPDGIVMPYALKEWSRQIAPYVNGKVRVDE